MIGLASYDSDEEAATPEQGKDEASLTGIVPKAAAAGPAPAAAKVRAAGKGKAKAKDGGLLPLVRLQHIRKEIDGAKSATAVVQVVRRNFDTQWDVRWGTDALQQIAKRSTARTRKEWADDPGVKKLAERLKALTEETTLPAGLGEEAVDVLLVALDSLRRMGFQEVAAQKDCLERATGWLAEDEWKRPVKSLARLLWLQAPLHEKGNSGESFGSLVAQLRLRASELDGPDVALIVAALRRPGGRDEQLLQKVIGRLQVKDIHTGLSATDLVEIAEGLCELEAGDEGALRPLGQEILRRRGELSPPESHRVHTAFQTMKLPLPQVWMKPGAAQKRDGSHLVTTQAFAPQDGHEKKRRGNNEVERVSPPRVVRDYKMMSY